MRYTFFPSYNSDQPLGPPHPTAGPVTRAAGVGLGGGMAGVEIDTTFTLTSMASRLGCDRQHLDDGETQLQRQKRERPLRSLHCQIIASPQSMLVLRSSASPFRRTATIATAAKRWGLGDHWLCATCRRNSALIHSTCGAKLSYS